jgi:hypothetical protein
VLTFLTHTAMYNCVSASLLFLRAVSNLCAAVSAVLPKERRCLNVSLLLVCWLCSANAASWFACLADKITLIHKTVFFQMSKFLGLGAK